MRGGRSITFSLTSIGIIKHYDEAIQMKSGALGEKLLHWMGGSMKNGCSENKWLTIREGKELQTNWYQGL